MDESSTNLYFDLDSTFSNLNDVIHNFIYDIYKIDLNIDIQRDRMDIYNLMVFTIKELSLENTNPEVAKEWNYEKNGDLKPNQFYSTSSRKVWWKCPIGHDYEATISHRTIDKNNCPYCSNEKLLKGYNDLSTTNPELLEIWNYQKNSNLGIYPDNIFAGSHKKVWWKCDNGHSYEAITYNVAKGRRCPYCSNKKVLKGYNDLTTTNPEILKLWNYQKNDELNIYPYDYSYGSDCVVWWKCENNHEWEQRINHIVKGIGCPKCRNRKISNLLSKKVLQCSMDGKLIKEYDSLKVAEIETKIQGSNISKVCNGKTKQAGGYIWKYKKD